MKNVAKYKCIIAILGALCVVLVIVVLLMWKAPFRYGGDVKLSRLEVKDAFSDVRLVLPFKYEQGYSDGGMSQVSFSTEEDFSELEERINALQSDAFNIKATIKTSHFMLIEYDVNQSKSYYYIRNLGGVELNRFYLQPANISFYAKQDDDWDSIYFGILFPLHLVVDKDLWFGIVDNGERYLAIAGKKAFLDFYEQAGLYEISDTDSGFIIHGYLNGRGGADASHWPIEYVFEENDGCNYFRVTPRKDCA